jgi:hypothetical protein
MSPRLMQRLMNIGSTWSRVCRLRRNTESAKRAPVGIDGAAAADANLLWAGRRHVKRFALRRLIRHERETHLNRVVVGDYRWRGSAGSQ